MGQKEGKIIVRRPVKSLFRGVWIRDDQTKILFGKIPWRRAWQPTPVFLPGESHGQRSLAGCMVHGVTKSQTRRKWLSVHVCNACYKRSSRIRPNSNLILFKDFWTRCIFSRETFQRVSIRSAQIHVEVRSFGHKEASWVRRWVAVVSWALHLVSSSLWSLIFITLWSYSSLLFLRSLSRSFQSFPLPVTTFNFHL